MGLNQLLVSLLRFNEVKGLCQFLLKPKNVVITNIAIQKADLLSYFTKFLVRLKEISIILDHFVSKSLGFWESICIRECLSKTCEKMIDVEPRAAFYNRDFAFVQSF